MRSVWTLDPARWGSRHRLEAADSGALEALAVDIVGLRSPRSVLRTIDRHLGRHDQPAG